MKHFALTLIAVILFGTLYFSATEFSHPLLRAQVVPPKTVVLKHPAAGQLNSFFAQTTVFTLYLYQYGTQQDLQALLLKLKKDKAVNSCVLGTLTGDYQALEVSLKQAQSKSWFVLWLKNAGLNSLKINNDPVKLLDQI